MPSFVSTESAQSFSGPEAINPNPKKNMNRQDAKLAKGMRFLSLQRRTRNRAHGELRVCVPLPNWPALALAFRVPSASAGCPWRLIFLDQG